MLSSIPIIPLLASLCVLQSPNQEGNPPRRGVAIIHASPRFKTSLLTQKKPGIKAPTPKHSVGLPDLPNYIGGVGGGQCKHIIYIYIYYYCIQYYPCNSGFSSLAGSVLEPWAVSQPKDTKRPNGKLIGTAWHQRACDRMLRTSCSKVISRTSGCLIFSIFQLFEKFLAGGFINIGRCMNGHQGHKQSVGCHERQGTSP